MKTATYYNQQALQSYYKWHAHFYDATRWSFLFGRKKLINKLPVLPKKPNILEVGCGTGYNLNRLQNRYPEGKITGIDLSSAMLSVASQKVNRNRNNINFIHGIYEHEELQMQTFDLILLSYSLTMMKTPVENIIQTLSQNLDKSGVVAVVDFHNSSYRWFRHWMRKNHVRMSEQWLPTLKTTFEPTHLVTQKAYMGLWSYFLFIGRGK